MAWPYTDRTDGKIAVSLDSNAWNYLHDRFVNLRAELPADDFAIFITREVEIEKDAIPPKTSKLSLVDYIRDTIQACGIRTTSVFGFSTPDESIQRVGGFDQGTWQSQTEREFYAAVRERYLLGKPERSSRLNHNEADAAVGAQSFSSVVVTMDCKAGPLRFAAEHGGCVLFLSQSDYPHTDLSARIRAVHSRRVS